MTDVDSVFKYDGSILSVRATGDLHTDARDLLADTLADADFDRGSASDALCDADYLGSYFYPREDLKVRDLAAILDVESREFKTLNDYLTEVVDLAYENLELVSDFQIARYLSRRRA